MAEKVAKLKNLFDKHENYTGQLLIAVDGGKQFLSVPANHAEIENDFYPPNADENAAINIGLRAVAHPDRWDIFPRLRTKEFVRRHGASPQSAWTVCDVCRWTREQSVAKDQ